MSRRFPNGGDFAQKQIINVLAQVAAGDVGSPVEAQFWWDSTLQRLKVRAAAATLTLLTGAADLADASIANVKLTTNPLDRGNHINSQTASTISDFNTAVRTNRLDQLAAPTAAVPMNAQKLTGLANGSAASDSAAYGQIQLLIDAAIAGKTYKDAVRVSTTAPGTLSTSFVNGAVVDGVTLATSDRILVKNQATQSENGIRVVAASGVPPRATDADTAAKIRNATVIVAEGTLAGTEWTQSTDGTITLDTTAINFAQSGAGANAYIAGNGLTLSGNTFDIGQGTGITVAADAIAIDTSLVVRKYAADIGNGALTSITVPHNFGTRYVTAAVFLNSGNYAEEMPDVLHTDANNLTVVFGAAPATNAYSIAVHG